LPSDSSPETRWKVRLPTALHHLVLPTHPPAPDVLHCPTPVLNLKDEPYQFLYHADGKIHLLHPQTFDEMEVSEHMIEGGSRLLPMLEDGMTITVGILTTSTTGGHPVSVRLPQTHVYTVASVTERAAQAAKGIMFKPATLANGCCVQVPEFVNVGERIVIEIEQMKYLRRA
ncbi:hypothetical protein BC937DRAFT_94974, partial [Endogone sp. FLAS-F59071]